MDVYNLFAVHAVQRSKKEKHEYDSKKREDESQMKRCILTLFYDSTSIQWHPGTQRGEETTKKASVWQYVHIKMACLND